MAPSVICDETLKNGKRKSYKAGEILLLENMRFEAGETKMMKNYAKTSFNGRCLYKWCFWCFS